MLLDERGDDTLMIEGEATLDVRYWFRASVVEPFEFMQKDDAKRVEISTIVGVIAESGRLPPARLSRQRSTPAGPSTEHLIRACDPHFPRRRHINAACTSLPTGRRS